MQTHPPESLVIRLSSFQPSEVPPDLVWVYRHVQACRGCRLAYDAARDIDSPSDARLKQRYARFVEANETTVGVITFAALAAASAFLMFLPPARKEPRPDDFP